MILVDTNILSTFAKIGRLELLFGIFRQKTLYLSPNVFQELKDAKKRRFLRTGEKIEWFKCEGGLGEYD